MLGIAYLANRAVAIFIETADFTGRHLDQRVTRFTVGNDGLLAGSAGYLAAGTRTNFNVVNGSTQRNVLQGHGIAYLGSNLLAAFHLHAHLQSRGGQNVGFFTILVLNQSNAAGTVGIVFDSKDSSGHIKLVAFEVHQAIFALMATANVAGGDAAIIIAATGFLEGSAETLFRGRGGDFVKGRPHLVTVRGSNWLE